MIWVGLLAIPGALPLISGKQYAFVFLESSSLSLNIIVKYDKQLLKNIS